MAGLTFLTHFLKKSPGAAAANKAPAAISIFDVPVKRFSLLTSAALGAWLRRIQHCDPDYFRVEPFFQRTTQERNEKACAAALLSHPLCPPADS
jgi:hypothetical protein